MQAQLVNQKSMLLDANGRLPLCSEGARLPTPTNHYPVRTGGMPQESDLAALPVIRPDDPDSATGSAAGAGAAACTTSLETRRVYAGAWQAFRAWCTSQGEAPVLPVPPERVAAFVESLPPSLGANGLKLRMAAIAKHHAERNLASPTAHAAVRAALRRQQAAGEAVLARLDSCGEDLAGLRNRALLLLVQAGGLTPADVAGIDREDLRFGDGEIVLSVRPAAAPAEQAGQVVRLPRRRGDPLCPAQALERWLQRSGITYGPVFRAVSVHGRLERRLGVVGVRRILQGIETQAVAQAMPEGRKLVPGAWRKPGKGKRTRGHSPGVSPMGSPARKPGRTW